MLWCGALVWGRVVTIGRSCSRTRCHHRCSSRRGAAATHFYFLLSTFLLSCDRAPREQAAPPPAGPAWFENTAAEGGLDFTWRSGHDGERYYTPESIGGGGALLDFDGDGDLDIYLVQAGSITALPGERPPNQLFENLGGGRFRDVTDGSGADDRGYGMGAAAGDVDDDGDVDLYVTNVGPNVLLRNDGGGRFTDVAAEAGVDHDGWGTSCALFDVDGDGDLDLVVLNYLGWSAEQEITCYNNFGAPDYCLPANYNAPGRAVLYRNDGGGRFTDVTEPAGLGGAVGTGLGLALADFDGDGRPDLFIANDGMPDQLWLNRGNGTMTEVGFARGCALDMEGKAKAGMGVAAGDVDGDLDMDVLVCNLRYESDSLFVNRGDHFVDATITAGLGAASRTFTRFGVGWADFDNDGWLDLYEANGRVYRESESWADDLYAEPNMLFRGGPGPSFDVIEPRGGTAEPLIHTSRAALFGDLDDDGGLDIVVVNRDGPACLLRNVVPRRGHWITLRVIDSLGRDAMGAVVDVRAGQRTWRRAVAPAYSFLASNDPRVHVGLGEAAAVESVRVRWPGGRVETFEVQGVDRVVTVREEEGGK